MQQKAVDLLAYGNLGWLRFFVNTHLKEENQ